MTQNRSFKDYIAKRFDNKFWEIAERYLQNEFDSSSLTFYRLHRPGSPEIDDVKVEHVWVDDLPGMDIQFDVALSLSLSFPEADHHYDTLGRSTIIDFTPTYSETHIDQVYSAASSNTTEEPAEPSHLEDEATPTLEAEIVDEVPAGEEEPHSGQTGQAPKATKQVIMNNYGKGVQIEELNGTLTININ